jgi:hypothetical protein
MLITLQRDKSSELSTIGKLFIDGEFFCNTLELPVMAECLPGRCAIPSGTYELLLEYSYHFQRYNLRLADVPGFQGIELHTGNSPRDTEGCVLLGTAGKQPDWIYDSDIIYVALMQKIRDYIFSDILAKYPVITLTIIDFV